MQPFYEKVFFRSKWVLQANYNYLQLNGKLLASKLFWFKVCVHEALFIGLITPQ